MPFGGVSKTKTPLTKKLKASVESDICISKKLPNKTRLAYGHKAGSLQAQRNQLAAILP